MASHTLGTIRGTIEIDYDGAGIVRAVRDSEKAKKSFGGIDDASKKVLGAFSSAAKGAAKFAGALNLVIHGASVLSGAVAALGPILAAGLATAPAIVLSVASALVIAKVAVSGVGDALKAAGEDSAKFEESLKKLSPEAQKFARAFRAALPQLVGVQKAIQDAFFKGAPGAVATIVNRIVSLKAQAAGVAFALGQVAQNIVKTATNAPNIEKLRLILSGVNAFLLQIRHAIGPVVTGFINLAAQGAKFGGLVGSKLAEAIGAFARFLNGIDLQSLFASALPIIQQFVALFKTVASIASQVFGIFTADGAGAVGVLGQLATQLDTFLKSAQGQEALAALGTAMQAISGAAGQIFLALLQALAPAIVALAPGVTVLAQQISGFLVPAIQKLAPLLLSLSEFLSDNMSWIGPLAGAVVALSAAYRAYVAVAGVVSAVQAALTSKIVVSTAKWIAHAVAITAVKVAQLANAAVMGGIALSTWIINTAAIVANRVALLAGVVAMAAVRAATIAWTAVQWALNVALNANPIGLVILAIAALVAGIILLWKNSETFRNIVKGVWAAIKTAIQATASWILNVAWPWIKKAFDFIANAVKAMWQVQQSIWKAITAVIRGAISAIVSVITSGINKAKTVINGIKTVINVVKSAFTSARNAAVAQLNALVSFVRSIPGRVTSAIGGLNRLLYNKGRDLIRGFINGIASMIGAVRDKVHSVVSSVTRFLPGSPAKEGPLSGKGYVLLRARRFMSDFAKGLQDGAPKPAAALVGSVGGLARATVPTGSTTRSGASTVAPTPPVIGGTREYNLILDGKVLATFVVDAITGNPIAVKKAADEGGRQGSFVGSGRGGK